MKKVLLKSKQIPLEFQSEPQKFKKYHSIISRCPNKFASVTSGGVKLVLKKNANLNAKTLITLSKLLKPTLKVIARSRVHFPIKLDTILTKKPKDIRMGRGKGVPSEKVLNTTAGAALFTLYNLTNNQAEVLSKSCKHKIKNSKIINNNKW